MNIEELIEQKIFINIQPLDSWDCWVYEIVMEDYMSPFFIAYRSFDDDLQFSSYNDTLIHAQSKVNDLLMD